MTKLQKFRSFTPLKYKLAIRKALKNGNMSDIAIIDLMTNTKKIPSELTEYAIKKPYLFKRLLIFIKDYTHSNPDGFSKDRSQFLEKLASDFFVQHLTFETTPIVHEIIEILFKFFPDHFTDLKHSIYHTALVHTFALHRTKINNDLNTSQSYTLSSTQVAKQLKLRNVVETSAKQYEFTFNPKYSEKPVPYCDLDPSQPISISELQSLTKDTNPQVSNKSLEMCAIEKIRQDKELRDFFKYLLHTQDKAPPFTILETIPE